MYGLNVILAKHSHLLVLRILHHADEPLTGREIQRRSGLSNRAVMLAAEALTEASAVHCEITSQAHWYTLNNSNYLVAKGLKPAYEAEDLFWEDLRKVIRRVIRPRPIAAVVTGPLARDEAEVTGRLEITMIFSTGRNRIRAFRCLDDLVDMIWDRYALNIEPNWLDVNNLDDDEHELLWRRVEREGVLLYGTLP